MTEILKRIIFQRTVAIIIILMVLGFGFSIGYDDDDKYNAVINYPLIMGL